MGGLCASVLDKETKQRIMNRRKKNEKPIKTKKSIPNQTKAEK